MKQDIDVKVLGTMPETGFQQIAEERRVVGWKVKALHNNMWTLCGDMLKKACEAIGIALFPTRDILQQVRKEIMNTVEQETVQSFGWVGQTSTAGNDR